MVKQTSLRNVRIRLEGVDTYAPFLFPFFDPLLQVRFLLITIDQRHFLLREPLLKEGRALLVSRRRLVSLGEIPPDLFHRYLHFDPWWTMRGAVTVGRVVREAVISSNVAARRYNQLAIKDVEFSDRLDEVTRLRIGDGVFRGVSYHHGKPMPWLMAEAFFGRLGLERPSRG